MAERTIVVVAAAAAVAVVDAAVAAAAVVAADLLALFLLSDARSLQPALAAVGKDGQIGFRIGLTFRQQLQQIYFLINFLSFLCFPPNIV